MDASTAELSFFFRREQFPRKEFQEFFIREHKVRLFRIPFSYTSPFRDTILLFFGVRTSTLDINIWSPIDRFDGNVSAISRYFDVGV